MGQLFGWLFGMLDTGNLNRMQNLIEKAGLPVKIPDFKIKSILEAIRHDKKAAAGKIKVILADGIGKAIISDGVNLSLFEQVLVDWNETT